MTQHLIEPYRCPLPEAWQAPAARPEPTPPRQTGGALAALACGTMTGLALCSGVLNLFASAL
jgi:hypothetical protein